MTARATQAARAQEIAQPGGHGDPTRLREPEERARRRGAPAAFPEVDGTFPTTVLEYRFFVEDESPACAEQLPEYSCQEMLLVEVTRLKP